MEKTQEASEKFETELTMKMGILLKQYLFVNTLIVNGIGTPEHYKEFEILTDSLNSIDIPLQFSCSLEDLPKDIRFFAKIAKTGCCRRKEPKKDKSRKRRG